MTCAEIMQMDAPALRLAVAELIGAKDTMSDETIARMFLPVIRKAGFDSGYSPSKKSYYFYDGSEWKSVDFDGLLGCIFRAALIAYHEAANG